MQNTQNLQEKNTFKQSIQIQLIQNDSQNNYSQQQKTIQQSNQNNQQQIIEDSQIYQQPIRKTSLQIQSIQQQEQQQNNEKITNNKLIVQQGQQKIKNQQNPISQQNLINEQKQQLIRFKTTNDLFMSTPMFSHKLLQPSPVNKVQQPQKLKLKKRQSSSQAKPNSIIKNSLIQSTNLPNPLTQSLPISQLKPSTSKTIPTAINNQSKPSKNKQKQLTINSPNLFTSSQSLLPNEVICIQNNSTRVVVHMSKKITALNDSSQNKQVYTNVSNNNSNNKIQSPQLIKSNKNINNQPSPSSSSSLSSTSFTSLSYLLGKLIVTNYKLIYIDHKYPFSMNFSYPLGYILKLQRTIQPNGISYIEITFKMGLTVKFKYHYEEFTYSQKIKDIILTLMGKSLFTAIDYGLGVGKEKRCRQFEERVYGGGYTTQSINKKDSQKITTNTTNNNDKNKNINNLFNLQAKSINLKSKKINNHLSKYIKGIQAQIIDNTNGKQMKDYPDKYIIPINYINRKNQQSRIVILSYIYLLQSNKQKKQKITLWRTGPGLPDLSIQDQWLPKTKTSLKHHSIEIKTKNIGTSKSPATRCIQIQGLYHLKQSYYKLNSLVYHYQQSSKWLQNVSSTCRWYEQICIIISQAQYIIQQMTKGVHMTLVCDTQARGAQVAAIVQLLMCPQYRTIDGFPQLVEKEFLHYSCPKIAKKQRQQDKSIILIQFLDCVYQFTHLYPLSFQFSQHYLVYIAEHIYSNKYGNFLHMTRQFNNNNNKDNLNEKAQILQKCACIWQDIKNKIQKDKQLFFEDNNRNQNQFKNHAISTHNSIHQLTNYYILFHNSFYIDHNQSNIFQLRNFSQISKGIKLWISYFLRKGYCCQSIKQQILLSNQITKRYMKISYEHNLMKKDNQIMRKKIAEQYRMINQRKEKLKMLREMV